MTPTETAPLESFMPTIDPILNSNDEEGGYIIPPHLARYFELLQDDPAAARTYLNGLSAEVNARRRRVSILRRVFTQPAHSHQRPL